jgi:hypothetical protein
MQVDSSVELGRDDPALEFPWCSEDGRIRYQDLKHNLQLIDHLPEVQQSGELRHFLLRINAPDCPLQTVKSDLWTTGEIFPEEDIFAARRKFVSYVDLVFAAPKPRLSFQAHRQIVDSLCSLLRRAPDIRASIEFILRHCYYRSVESQNRSVESETCSVESQSCSVESQSCSVERESYSVESESGQECSVESQSCCVESQNRSVESEKATQSDRWCAGKTIVRSTDDRGCGGRPGNNNEPFGDLRTDSCTGFCITTYVAGFGDDDLEAWQQWGIALKLLQHVILQASCA